MTLVSLTRRPTGVVAEPLTTPLPPAETVRVRITPDLSTLTALRRS